MKTIGNQSSFGLEIGLQEVDNSNLRKVSIFVGNQNICVDDNLVYIPSFVSSLIASANYLKNKIDYVKFEKYFLGLSTVEAHEFIKNTANVVSPEYKLVGGNIYGFHRFLDWGETTDNNISFLIPINSFLYLTCEYNNNEPRDNVISASKVYPYQIIKTLEEAIDELKN